MQVGLQCGPRRNCVPHWQERPVLDNEVLHNKSILDIFKYPLRGSLNSEPQIPDCSFSQSQEPWAAYHLSMVTKDF